ncbi:Nitrogen permease reactivator protein [Kickxella alabastrina]|nr:Nitrogen permease reactivator protein [Kickxella alabastrina]
MAPEIFQDTNYSAPKVDIWALAIMYFAMCHLQFPWAAAQPSRDPRYANFARNSGAFFDTWFPTKESTWSSRVSFLATQKINSCNNDGGGGRMQGSTVADTGAACRVRDIIGRMLDPNPEVRADIEEIAADPWFLSLGAVAIKPAAKNRLKI